MWLLRHCELRLAAALYPDAVFCVAPGMVEDAVRLTELAEEAGAMRSVGGAERALTVLPFAHDFRRVRRKVEAP